MESGVGTGVVIVDKGIILTNLHVVSSAKRVGVVFADGTRVGGDDHRRTQPENDLAVLQAKTIPDDLPPATLRSTSDLALGDEVVAVGFPVRHRAVGLGGRRVGAAARVPLAGGQAPAHQPDPVRRRRQSGQLRRAARHVDGEVVGIVTGILNPTDQRVFIGIGFAVPIENAASAVGISPF